MEADARAHRLCCGATQPLALPLVQKPVLPGSTRSVTLRTAPTPRLCLPVGHRVWPHLCSSFSCCFSCVVRFGFSAHLILPLLLRNPATSLSLSWCLLLVIHLFPLFCHFYDFLGAEDMTALFGGPLWSQSHLPKGTTTSLERALQVLVTQVPSLDRLTQPRRPFRVVPASPSYPGVSPGLYSPSQSLPQW